MRRWGCSNLHRMRHLDSSRGQSAGQRYTGWKNSSTLTNTAEGWLVSNPVNIPVSPDNNAHSFRLIAMPHAGCCKLAWTVSHVVSVYLCF